MTLTKSGDAIRTRLHPDTLETLGRAFNQGFSTKSDFARVHANHVACAASLGLISTALPDGNFGNRWRTTETGVKVLFEQYFLDTKE